MLEQEPGTIVQRPTRIDRWLYLDLGPHVAYSSGQPPAYIATDDEMTAFLAVHPTEPTYRSSQGRN